MLVESGSPPLYRVFDEESGEVLVVAEGVRGFFVNSEEFASEVTFLGVRQVNEAERKVEDAILEIMGSRQEKIGEYYVGRAVRGEIKPLEGGAPSTVTYRIFNGRCEYPEAERVWRRWASGVELEQGEWFQWPSSYREAWLHVVQNSWFASHRRAARYCSSEIVYLDGVKVTEKPGFYCALGEATNGPGGYYGSNRDGLVDCLSSEYGERLPLKIVWQDYRTSRNSLGGDFVDSIIAIMRDFNVQVITR